MLLTMMPLLFGRLGVAEIVIIVALLLLLFGGTKIPELMRGLGRGVKEFKDAVNTDYSKENDAETGKKEDAEEK